MGNGHNIVSSSEYLLPKNDTQYKIMQLASEPISTSASQNALPSSLASSSMSPPLSQSNILSQNYKTNYKHANENPGIPVRGIQEDKYAISRESNPHLGKGHSPERKGQGLTRENVNDHNHLNSTSKHQSQANKNTYISNKERQIDVKHSNGNKEASLTDKNGLDLDQTTMIGSALDLDSLSGDDDQNKHINNAQDFNTCDENNFVTTKASSISEQCKTAGISAIYHDKTTRTSNIKSTRQSIISENSETYYQAPNYQKSFDPSAV